MSIRVGDIKLQNYSRDTYNSLKPITWLLDVFAINSNVENGVYSKFYYVIKCLFTFTILAFLDLGSLFYKMVYLYKHTTISLSIKVTDTVQMIFDLCQYVVDLWFVSKYGRQISVEYFRQYECIDEILGMTSYNIIKWKLVRLLSFFTFIWISSSGLDYVAWFLSYGWIAPISYAISYIFLYIKILTALDLSSHAMHIEYRLKIISDIIRQHYSIAEPLPGIIGNYLSQKIVLYPSLKKKATSARVNPIMQLQLGDECMEVKLLTRVYLQLTEQVEFINSMFGFRILLNSLSLLIDIIRFTNIAVRIVLGTQAKTPMPDEMKYFPATSSTMRQITCVLVMISLVSHCEAAYRQRDKIISTIDHLLINKNPSKQLREAMTDLRVLMEARPICFNLEKFFKLNNSLLVSIASVVVTYTIILLQTMN